MSSTDIPALKAYRRYQMRSEFGRASFWLMSSIVGCWSVPHRSRRSQPMPNRPTSSPRRAFWSDSLKVRPMAIVSPTDFIWVVSVGSASGNFSKANRGTFVTT